MIKLFPFETFFENVSDDHRIVSFYLAVAMAIVVGAALAFEHIGGYIPCALCLEQRTPYYLGVPTLVLAGMAACMSAPSFVIRGLIAIAGLLMVYGFVLGVFHSGVEWAFWAGPENCGVSADGLSRDVNDLLGDLNAKRPPACGDAALRVLGLSFAGWNAVMSAILAFFTLRLAARTSHF